MRRVSLARADVATMLAWLWPPPRSSCARDETRPVAPRLRAARWHDLRSLAGPALLGIGRGFRNPFAALWGRLDEADVLWIKGEILQTRNPAAVRRSPSLGHASHVRRVIRVLIC